MKKYALLFISILGINVLSAQVVDKEKTLREQDADTLLGWRSNGIVVITASQSSFNNWAAGGQNSISGNGLLNFSIGYKTKRASWDNNLEVGYGLIKQGGGDDPKWIKSDDKFDFTSKYGRRISDKWFYGALANFRTQFSPGYNYPNDTVKISDFLAPAYVLTAIGFDYKPEGGISAFIAPITSRTIYVNNQYLADLGSFGLDPAKTDEKGNVITHAKKVKNEFGGYIKLVYKKDDLIKNVGLLTKADFFSNYLKNPQNIVVNWETLISLKVNKLLTVTISTNLIYDDAIKIPTYKDAAGIQQYHGPRTQFKEVLGVGIAYKFSK